MFFGMYHSLAGWLAEMLSALSDRTAWPKQQNLVSSGNISKLYFGVHNGWLVEPLAVLWSVCGRTTPGGVLMWKLPCCVWCISWLWYVEITYIYCRY